MNSRTWRRFYFLLMYEPLICIFCSPHSEASRFSPRTDLLRISISVQPSLWDNRPTYWSSSVLQCSLTAFSSVIKCRTSRLRTLCMPSKLLIQFAKYYHKNNLIYLEGGQLPMEIELLQLNCAINWNISLGIHAASQAIFTIIQFLRQLLRPIQDPETHGSGSWYNRRHVR